MLFNEDFHPATPPAITLANATGTGKHSADQWIKQFKTANQYVKYGDILSDNSHHYFTQTVLHDVKQCSTHCYFSVLSGSTHFRLM
jgi:hypothetical protein